MVRGSGHRYVRGTADAPANRQALQKDSDKTPRRFFGQQNCRNEERIAERLQQIRQAVAATTDKALMQTGLLCIQNSVALLEIMRDL
jgi:hypothetical protein